MILLALHKLTAKSWTSEFDVFLTMITFPIVELTSDAQIPTFAREMQIPEDHTVTALMDLLDLIADSDDAGL
jgi:hypothetical protein